MINKTRKAIKWFEYILNTIVGLYCTLGTVWMTRGIYLGMIGNEGIPTCFDKMGCMGLALFIALMMFVGIAAMYVMALYGIKEVVNNYCRDKFDW